MPGSRVNTDLWITEYISPYDIYQHGVVAVLDYRKTSFQEMCIVETGSYGKALVLDGKWQSCTVDEFLYHEPLVHPACVAHGGPRTVLILGGGEGATAREVLRWKTVERVVMVDLDGEVVEACRRHLPEMHQGAFDDPRMELVIGDALDYLDQGEPVWDVIISDLSDPIEEGPSFKLFTKEYFEQCRQALSSGGVFVVQAGPLAPPDIGLHLRLVNTVAAVFANAVSYGSHVPSYASPWGYVLASDSGVDCCPEPAAVDALLAAKTTGGLRMFDGVALRGLMSPPKHIREAIAAETRIFTLSDPPKFFGAGVAES
ncbi:MAG: spermidine synthase [bacterium]|nr:spermidine synthase [bacterium]